MTEELYFSHSSSVKILSWQNNSIKQKIIDQLSEQIVQMQQNLFSKFSITMTVVPNVINVIRRSTTRCINAPDGAAIMPICWASLPFFVTKYTLQSIMQCFYVMQITYGKHVELSVQPRMVNGIQERNKFKWRVAPTTAVGEVTWFSQ